MKRKGNETKKKTYPPTMLLRISGTDSDDVISSWTFVAWSNIFINSKTVSSLSRDDYRI